MSIDFKCKICGKDLNTNKSRSQHIQKAHNIQPKDYYDNYLKIDGEGFCRTCGKDIQWKAGKGYSRYCSASCGMKDTEIQKHINNKETNLKRSENYKNKSEEDIAKETEKRIATNLKRYGTTHPMKNIAIKDKMIQTTSKNPTKLVRLYNTYDKFKSFDNKIIPLFTKDDYVGGYNHAIGVKYKWKCVKCENIFEEPYYFHPPICPNCKIVEISKDQVNIINYIKTLVKDDVYINDRNIIKPFELDIYIKSKNIGIEFDGLYWHSEIQGDKDRNYHFIKTKKLENVGIKLIHIFSDEWIKKERIVKTRIKHILNMINYKIYARKCIVKEIDNTLKNKFLNKYHLQGDDKSVINLGLYYRSRLVSVMTFSKLRKALGNTHKEGYYELSRFCSINSFNIIGGASKLLSHFENIYKPIKIITYADRRWSTGNMYFKLGFTLDHISKPNYWYLDSGCRTRYHRYNFRKNILSKKLEDFNAKLSEWENMKANGYDRIWDCGNLVFMKNYPKKNLAGSTSTNPLPVNNCSSNSFFSVIP